MSLSHLPKAKLSIVQSWGEHNRTIPKTTQGKSRTNLISARQGNMLHSGESESEYCHLLELDSDLSIPCFVAQPTTIVIDPGTDSEIEYTPDTGHVKGRSLVLTEVKPATFKPSQDWWERMKRIEEYVLENGYDAFEIRFIDVWADRYKRLRHLIRFAPCYDAQFMQQLPQAFSGSIRELLNITNEPSALYKIYGAIYYSQLEVGTDNKINLQTQLNWEA